MTVECITSPTVFCLFHIDKTGTHVWLGAKADNKKWSWTGLVSSPLVYSDWESGEPSYTETGTNCMCLWTNLGWKDCQCALGLSYMCEKRADPKPVTSSTSTSPASAPAPAPTAAPAPAPSGNDPNFYLIDYKLF